MISIPDAYVYGSTSHGDVDDERDSDEERVEFVRPVVTRITDMICARVYLAANEIDTMISSEKCAQEGQKKA